MNQSVDTGTSPNDTDPCIITRDFGTYIVYITTIITFISVGECLTITFVICFTEKLHHNANIVVASLAINDFLLAIGFLCNQISLVPLRLSHLMKSKLVRCFISGLLSGTTTLSVIHMAVIAVDRYIQIVHPFHYMKAMTRTRTYLILLGLWIVDFIFIIIPPAVFYDDKYHRLCILLHMPLEYSSTGQSVYFISLIVVFICYFKIAHVAFKHRQSANARRHRFNVSQADIGLRNNVTAAVRSVQFFALMFGIFCVCTLPPTLISQLGFLSKVSDNIYVGLFSIVPIHSVINFVIYAYMKKEFYNSLIKKLLAVKRVCCRDSTEI